MQAKREDVHYLPFTNAHIKRIFDPKPFLSNSRDPDYFWGPCLGLYLGVRLGDVVDAKVADMGYMAAIDTWYIEVPVDRAKNDNSVRRLPITRPLIELDRAIATRSDLEVLRQRGHPAWTRRRSPPPEHMGARCRRRRPG